MGCCGGHNSDLSLIEGASGPTGHCCGAPDLAGPNFVTMTLARALTYKKRVAERLSLVEEGIISNNSIMAESEREVDVEALYQERCRLVAHMIDLKLKIQRATDPIRELIFRLAELKSENEFVRRIPTTHGVSKNLYARCVEGVVPTITYSSIIRKSDVDETVRGNNTRIDQCQEQIERHNYNTRITIEDIGL